MLESLPSAKPDAIIQLMEMYREDARPNKIDLGVGVYKAEYGNTPVMAAVKSAEKNLLRSQDTKTYVGSFGNLQFCSAMTELVFGKDAQIERIQCAQTTGGTGALRIVADLLKRSHPEAKIRVSDPTWPNHLLVFSTAGFKINTYPYYYHVRSKIDFDAMIESLEKARNGDIVVLHGCCHNPTGADLTMQQWISIANVCAAKSLFPLFDLAYQGFGNGLDEDVSPIRLFAERLPELAVASSCSKNIGIYRERTGAAIILAESKNISDIVKMQLSVAIRANYSMPSDHGGAVCDLVLNDSQLNNQRRLELEHMRQRIGYYRNSMTKTASANSYFKPNLTKY